MDMLNGIGNHYPVLYDDRIYILNDDEKMILDNMLLLNQNFLDLISEQGFLSNQEIGKAFLIDTDKANGLIDLIDLVNAMEKAVDLNLNQLSEFSD